MAFVKETGLGLANSNAYCDDTEFTAHHLDRGAVASGEFTTAEIQAAIINATDYIDKRFARRFRGIQLNNSQALQWPRRMAYNDAGFAFDPIPTQLKKATNEYALIVLHLEHNLAPVPATEFATLDADGNIVSEASGVVTSKTETVGPITESTGYESFAASGHAMESTGNMTQRIPAYPQADLWLEWLLDTGSREVARG